MLSNGFVGDRTGKGTASRRRLKKGRRGVSDIIGTILILAITVTLFSSIFFFVTSLPGPTPQSTSQFTSQLGLSKGTETFVNVTYTTGPVLSALPTALKIFLYSAKHTSAFCKNPYSAASGGVTGTLWTAGQKWSLGLNATNVCGAPLSSQNDSITITIVNVIKDLVLFQAVLPGTQANVPPEFISDGYGPSSPVSNTGPFYVWAQIHDDDLNTNSVFANFSSLPNGASGTGYISKCSCMKMSFNSTSGDWVSAQATANSNSVIGNSYPITINATDNKSQANSAVLYVSFLSPPGANLQVVLSASPGNPIIHQNTTITATISNQGAVGSSKLVVKFTASNGDFCPSQKPGSCPQKTSFNITTSIAPFASGVLVSAYWNATGSLPSGDGRAVITATVSLTSSAISPLVITVYPRTVLIDGTGVAQGSTQPIDPFTFLTTGFNSANIPYTTITATPGSQTITWLGTGSTALINYDVIVWDVGNASSSNPLTNTCLSTQDAQALNTALGNGKNAWMIGGDAFACPTASYYNGAFGVSSSSQSQAASPAQLSLVGAGIVPKAGYPATMYQGAGSFDSTLTLSGPSSYSYLCTGACGSSNNLATGYKPGGGKGNAFTTSFDLATVSSITYYPGGSPYPYTVNTGAQASITYNAFNFLAGFTGSGTPPPNVNYGADWAVSGVVVEPPSISFMSRTFVNVTVRNNGNYTTSITAELLINGIPYPSSAPLKVTLTPTALGGSLTGTITWLPPAVGYLTIGAEILPPINDSNPGNNILYSSLFNAQTYVGYSVLVVDGAVQLNPDVTNSTIIPSLKAAGYNQSTINYTYIGGLGCGTLGVSLNNYNLVVWNIGRVTNNSGYCPLSDNNANILSSFLVNGGLKSSLLFLGPGLMTDTSDTIVKTFAQSYLGTSITGSLTTSGKYVSSVFGKTTDVVGNGLDIPYNHPNTGNANYTCSQYGTGSTSLYYNVTGTMTDYWQGQNFCAGTREQGNNGWHSAYWAFNTISAGTSGQLSLAFLRVSTFFGRLLPNSDTVIASPDVTFSQVGSNFGNFDTMHPQLEQQYLIVANVTNLGASTASNVGVSIFDGSHILGLQTLTIGGSSVNITGTTLLGVGQTSISWVPLYAGTNEITVKITTSTAGQILPGVSNIARGNVSVSFFYDLTKDNVNSWSHNQLYLQQTGFSPSSCSPSPVGLQIFKWDDMNVPKVWPGFGSCTPPSPLPASWGISTTSGLCYDLSEGGCGSLGIQDSNGATMGGCGYAYCGYVTWQYSSPITVPSKATGLTSASVSWEQKYSIAQYANGGVVCIVTNTGSIPNGGYGIPLEDMINCDSSTPSPTPTDSQTTIAVDDPVACYLIPAFTGSSGSGSFSWQQETMNLTAYAGKTIYLAFGFVQGGYNSCESLSSPPALSNPSGWYIDDFMVTFSSNGANPGYISGGTAVPSDLWRLYPGSALTSSLTQMGTGAPPTGSAWVSAAWDGSTTVFDANMWDSLTSRPIDLSSAIDANLTFTYAFSNVMWVTEWPGYVCYVYTQDPSQGMVLQIAQANTQNWVTVWSANGFDNSCGLWPPHSVGDTYSSYNIYEYYGYTPVNTATVTSWGWQPTYVNLNGYVGQVIQLRFLVGTNNGGNGNIGSEYQDTNVCYPMTQYSGASCNPGNSPLASGGMISGIFINGNTSLSSGPGPSISLQNPRHATAEAPASHAFRDLDRQSHPSIHVPTTVMKSEVVEQVSSSGPVSEGEAQTMFLTSAPSHTMSVARWIPRTATTT